MRRPLLALPLVAACVPSAGVPKDPAAGADTGSSGAGGQTHAVVATSFEGVGALATVDLDTLAVTDEIASISSDAVVVVEDDRVFQLNRSDFDSVRIYAPGDFTAPELEIGLAAGANAWDVEVCAGRLFVAQYETDALAVYDLETGVLAGSVDLSDHDDGDGYPEVAALVELDGTLYVAMQQLDREGGWVAAGGTVAEVDCAAMTAGRAWEVGPNPTISAWPGSADTLLVRTGVYGEADGGLRTLDVATDTLSPVLLTEQAHGVDLTHVGLSADGARGVVLSSSLDWPATYGIWCVDTADWSLSPIESTDTFLSTMAVDDRDRAWVSFQAPSWGSADAVPGMGLYDLATCAPVRADRVPFVLDPGSMAFY
jgi:hypothetical protein